MVDMNFKGFVTTDVPLSITRKPAYVTAKGDKLGDVLFLNAGTKAKKNFATVTDALTAAVESDDFDGFKFYADGAYVPVEEAAISELNTYVFKPKDKKPNTWRFAFMTDAYVEAKNKAYAAGKKTVKENKATKKPTLY
jgi:hypothetical protein